MIDAVHLRPTDREANAWFGDAVPFYWNGTYHLFYVWDQGHLILPRVCHKWGHFASKDLVHWEELPMAIEPTDEASDGTGTVYERDGIFHMYYLGRYFTTNGIMYETLCHATSHDLIHWEKDPNNPISRPDLSRYSVKDWRDGFPFWNEEAQEYWMLVTASLKDGPANKRGCIALLASKDLWTWETRDPYWAPYLGRHLECPDLFEWNGWWYLVFSGGYEHAGGTLYRRSRSFMGPWESVPVDTFDAHEFYAAKTTGDGHRRFIFGWLGTRKENKDNGGFQWGGHGLMRELWQDEQGYLWAKCPVERLQLGTPVQLPTFESRMGTWTVNESGAAAEFNYGLSYATAEVPRNMLFQCRFKPEGAAKRFGLLLRTDADLTKGYRVSVEPARNRFVVTSFAPEGVPRAQPMERPLACQPGEEVTIRVFVSDSIMEVFVNDRAALAGRYYDHKGGSVGLFVEEGAGRFTDFSLRALPEETW